MECVVLAAWEPGFKSYNFHLLAMCDLEDTLLNLLLYFSICEKRLLCFVLPGLFWELNEQIHLE